MLLRICLVVAILAGAGVVGVGHFMLRPQIQSIIDEREKNAKDRDMEKTAKQKAQKELKDTTAKLKDTEKDLGETQKHLASTKTQLDAEQKRANGLKQDLDNTRQTLNEKEQIIARWEGIGLDPSEVKGLIAREKELQKLNKGLDEEKKFFAKKYKDTKAQLDQLLGENTDPPMTPGLRGKVLVVDPKWNFVVVDVGEKQGAVLNGVLMISRNSRLVAKVRIMNLQAERSIANVMQGWKLGEVLEGDLAIY